MVPLISHLPSSCSAYYLSLSPWDTHTHTHTHTHSRNEPSKRVPPKQCKSQGPEQCVNERQLTLQVMHFNGFPWKCLYPTMEKKKNPQTDSSSQAAQDPGTLPLSARSPCRSRPPGARAAPAREGAGALARPSQIKIAAS